MELLPREHATGDDILKGAYATGDLIKRTLVAGFLRRQKKKLDSTSANTLFKLV